MGAIEIGDFSGVGKLAVDVIYLEPQAIVMRRGSERPLLDWSPLFG